MMTPRRTGLTLIELLVVVTLMGIFASTLLMRFSRDILGDTGARSVSRNLSIGLLQAQRAAIRTGDLHGVAFSGSDQAVSDWTIVRKNSAGTKTLVGGPFPIDGNIIMTTNRSDIWFDFEGNGDSQLLVSVSGPHRAYRVTVQPLTQMIRSEEITP